MDGICFSESWLDEMENKRKKDLLHYLEKWFLETPIRIFYPGQNLVTGLPYLQGFQWPQLQNLEKNYWKENTSFLAQSQ